MMENNKILFNLLNKKLFFSEIYLNAEQKEVLKEFVLHYSKIQNSIDYINFKIALESFNKRSANIVKSILNRKEEKGKIVNALYNVYMKYLNENKVNPCNFNKQVFKKRIGKTIDNIIIGKKDNDVDENILMLIYSEELNEIFLEFFDISTIIFNELVDRIEDDFIQFYTVKYKKHYGIVDLLLEKYSILLDGLGIENIKCSLTDEFKQKLENMLVKYTFSFTRVIDYHFNNAIKDLDVSKTDNIVLHTNYYNLLKVRFKNIENYNLSYICILDLKDFNEDLIIAENDKFILNKSFLKYLVDKKINDGEIASIINFSNQLIQNN